MCSSVEPGRKAPYQVDLRMRVVWQRVVHDLTFVDIGRRLGIASSTAHRIFTQFVDTGGIEPVGRHEARMYMRKMDEYMEMFVIGLILEEPYLYLKELCVKVKEYSGVEVCEATICKLLHRHGVTRKKMRQVALQRSCSVRGHFMAKVLLYPKIMYVFLDETDCDNRSFMRKYGNAIRSEVPVCRRLLVRGQRISAIAAISCDGVVALEMKKGTVDSDIFYDFVRGSLIPQMQTFDGVSARSVVIMDNCSIHHVPEVKDIFARSGIPVFFLPPYSPDNNPIEEAFSYVKGYLRKHDNLLQSISDPCDVIKSAFDSITPSHCNQWINHSGYC